MDERLIPSDVHESDALTPSDHYERCIHAYACAEQFARLRGKLADGETYSIMHLIHDLGCGEDCDAYDEDDTGDLRRVVKQLIETVRVGEAECDCALMAHRLKSDLRGLGFEV